MDECSRRQLFYLDGVLCLAAGGAEPQRQCWSSQSKWCRVPLDSIELRFDDDGMCEYHPCPLPGGSSKSADPPERSAGAATSDLVDSLVAALAEARLAMDALMMNLSTRHPKKNLESRRDKTQEAL